MYKTSIAAEAVLSCGLEVNGPCWSSNYKSYQLTAVLKEVDTVSFITALTQGG